MLSNNTNLAYRISATTGSAKRIAYYDNSKTFISRQLISTTQGNLNIPGNALYVRLSCYNDDLESLQLEIIEDGSTATPYVEHEEQTYSIPTQQPMRSIGDVKDVFFKNVKDSKYYNKNLTLNGWYERHYIGRYVFTGNETILNGQKLTNVIRFFVSVDGMVSGNALSNNYRFLLNYTSDTEHFYTGTNQVLIFHNNSIGTGDNLKSLLAQQYANGTPVYIDYPLATPLDLPCTEEQIEILENPPKTCAGQTNIYSIDEVKAYLKAKGLKDLNKLINN